MRSLLQLADKLIDDKKGSSGGGCFNLVAARDHVLAGITGKNIECVHPAAQVANIDADIRTYVSADDECAV